MENSASSKDGCGREWELGRGCGRLAFEVSTPSSAESGTQHVVTMIDHITKKLAEAMNM